LAIGFDSFVVGVRAGAEAETFPPACNCGTTIFMKKSIKVPPKKKGRGRPPSGGRDPHVTVRMPQALIDQADIWGAENGATRSEAIRHLVELGLKSDPASKPSSKPTRASRAAELAAKAIDKMIDSSAPADERDQRRRRLTKGPPEFREDRVDLPKAKGK
jgi:hypothetical protein